MANTTATPGRQTLAYIAFGVLYYLLAVYAASLPFQTRLPLYIWPAHGLALGTLLVAPTRRWPAYVGLILAASVLIGFQLAAPWQRVALMVAVNVILPFFVGPRTQGVLIIGEERRSRRQPMSPERVAILELVASRIAHILRMSRRLEHERTAERRRERKLTIERQQLAREVHDEVGQALSGLLVQIRLAMARGSAGKEELQVLERATRSAVDGARALAYGFRHLDRGIGALEHARSFSETLLRASGCVLTWTEERSEERVAGKTLREIGRVVKESISNIVRHANAKAVRVRLEYPDGLIRVTIHDDGVGFAPREVRPSRDGRGLGLVGNAERMARLGGVFDVRSSKKGGTMVLIEAPRKMSQ